MSSSPWPSRTEPAPLFLLDAAHTPEEQLLREWLRRTAPDGETPVALLLPIASRQEAVDGSALVPFLELPPDTALVPVRVVWQTGRDDEARPTPRLVDLVAGDPRHPGAARARRVLEQHADRAQPISGASASLGELRSQFTASGRNPAQPGAFAQFIAGRAGLALDIAERRLRGGRYKVPRRVAANLKASRRYQRALAEVAEQTGETIAALEARAEGIFRELIAIPRTFWQDVIASFNRKMIGMGYDPEFVVDQEALERIRTIVRNRPAVLLWTHKTHVDGFAVYSMLFENDFPVPHLLGGVNMAFAGLGYAARRSGGIFIRRSFQDDLLYKMILRQYIGYLLEKRFPLTWAFEGTRSRVGKLMPPRYGVLKYVVEAAASTGAEDLHVIPVALNYDQIGDVRDYVREQGGGVKQPESLGWFIGYLRGLRRKLGKIYIDFGEPIVVGQPAQSAEGLPLKKLAFEVGVEVNRVTPLTLASVVTTILLGAAPRALTRNQLGRQMRRYLHWARERGIRIASDFDQGTPESLNALADVLGDNGLVTRFDEGPDVVYTLAPEQHGVASYYRNTTVHHFIVKAIAELALCSVRPDSVDRVGDFRAETERLRDLFKFEFFYAPSEEFRQRVAAELEHYASDWSESLSKDPEFAGDLLRRFRPLVARACLLPYVEAYGVVANVFCRIPGDASLDRKALVEQALSFGRQAYLQRRITSEASIGKLLFENGHRLMDNLGLVTPGGESLTEARRQFAHSLSELAARFEQLYVLDAPPSSW